LRAYGGYGSVQGNFQRIGGLTKWLVALLGITLVVQVVTLLVQFTLRCSATSYDSISSSQFDDKLGLYLGVALLAAAISISQAVILII
jgi:hypothetical protein